MGRERGQSSGAERSVISICSSAPATLRVTDSHSASPFMRRCICQGAVLCCAERVRVRCLGGEAGGQGGGG